MRSTSPPSGILLAISIEGEAQEQSYLCKFMTMMDARSIAHESNFSTATVRSDVSSVLAAPLAAQKFSPPSMGVPHTRHGNLEGAVDSRSTISPSYNAGALLSVLVTADSIAIISFQNAPPIDGE